jgi:hypothetical protein
MSVSSLTELHTPCQTLGFSIVSKEKPLFKSVTGLNPVFQPILTVTIVTVKWGGTQGSAWYLIEQVLLLTYGAKT